MLFLKKSDLFNANPQSQQLTRGSAVRCAASTDWRGTPPHPPPRFRSHAQHVELAGPPLTTAVAAAQLMRFPGQDRGGFRQERRLTSLKGGTFLNG